MKIGGINYLIYPLYPLYYLDDINDYKLDKKHFFYSMKNNVYEQEIINNIVKTIDWAIENPNFDFQSILPELSFSNDEIYQYLCHVKEMIS